MKEEQRRHPRKPCHLAVDGFAGDSTFKAFAKNISLGGAFIETPYAFATRDSGFKALAENISLGGAFIGPPYAFATRDSALHAFDTNEEIVLLFFVRPYQEEPIRVVGKIAWNASSGLGVEFRKTPKRLTTTIESFA